ncbi:AraC family transcriptional regulator [Mucilaginibacter sp. HC2]|uniref:AraC family transcriptional regulator n=1 Tax=Mucilaginibacter inviolabilis TaxID=2714892 RepID=UPI00140A7802|nr:helix-turn-helix domain-containing protein [Mucilaginibacter inviolabilis]NHA06641.1 AraC family transcriptional regulator [Mucilaginibacter inviolabilis]
MNNIPLHLLKDKTGLGLGLHIKHFIKGEPSERDPAILGAHRDDHYIFFVLEDGVGSVVIDFNKVQLSGGMLYYILPTQVHHRILSEEVGGWYIAVDTSLISPQCRKVFEGQLFLQQPYTFNDTQLRQCQNLLSLLLEKYHEDDNDPFYATTIHALLKSFLNIAAGCYNGYSGTNLKVSRPAQLTSQFKSLLVAELRSNKSPADYAAMLNVSEAYLSEALKKVTGFPVSYWIQQEVTMEAKRLLYYSQLTVKEIAHTLGFTDHSYFSRLFRKVTGTSAIAFREQYRK